MRWKLAESLQIPIDPNHEQQQYLANVFGFVRFIFNKMLADKIEHYKQTGMILILHLLNTRKNSYG